MKYIKDSILIVFILILAYITYYQLNENGILSNNKINKIIFINTNTSLTDTNRYDINIIKKQIETMRNNINDTNMYSLYKDGELYILSILSTNTDDINRYEELLLNIDRRFVYKKIYQQQEPYINYFWIGLIIIPFVFLVLYTMFIGSVDKYLQYRSFVDNKKDNSSYLYKIRFYINKFILIIQDEKNDISSLYIGLFIVYIVGITYDLLLDNLFQILIYYILTVLFVLTMKIILRLIFSEFNNDRYKQLISTYEYVISAIILSTVCYIGVVSYSISMLNIGNSISDYGLIGAIVAAIGFGANIWAPDIFHTLVILKSKSLEIDDIIKIKDEEYLVRDITLFETVLVDCTNNNRVIIRNQNIASMSIDNLTQRSKALGFRDKIVLKISYNKSDMKSYDKFNNKVHKMICVAYANIIDREKSELDKLKQQQQLCDKKEILNIINEALENSGENVCEIRKEQLDEDNSLDHNKILYEEDKLFDKYINRTVYINTDRDVKIFIDDIGDFAIHYNVFYYNNEVQKTKYTAEARQIINTRRVFIEEILKQSFRTKIDLKTPIIIENDKKRIKRNGF